MSAKFGWCLDRECDYCLTVTASGLRCSCGCHIGQTVDGPRVVKPRTNPPTEFEDAAALGADEPAGAVAGRSS